MNVARLKAWLSASEILTGLGAAGIGSYLLWDLSNCNPNAALCRPLGMLPVLLLLVPGCLAAAAGFVSYRSKRFPFWVVQTALAALVVLYFASLYGFVLVLGS